MAEVKNYGLSGVHRTLQLGKQGPILVGNASTDSFTVTLQDAATLTTMGGANASSPEHFITKAQLDVVYTEAQFLANVNYNDSSPILLGNISAGVKTIITTFEVDTAFDGNAVITVGTGDDNSLLMSDSYAEIEVTGSYQTTGLFEFASDTSLNIYVTQGGATQGAGKVLVSVVDGPVVDGGTINYGGAGGGLTDVVSDTSPQLGGNLDLNSYEINGNGNVNILGQVRVNDGGSAGITINAPYILTGDPNTSLILTSDDTTNWIQIPGSDTADAVTVAHEGVNGVVALKAGTNELQFVANGTLTVPGNVTAQNFNGNINITGNVTGTSANVTLVAGSYSATMDNTGFFSAPILKSTNSSGNEGGELQLAKSANATISTGIVIDSYNDRLRIFEGGGSARGVHIDLAKAPAGVAGELLWKASGVVDAGTFVTLDNLKVTVPTSGNRGLSVAAVSGSFSANIGAWYGGSGGSGGDSINNLSVTTTESGSLFSWNFVAEGNTAQYTIYDKTNSRMYRVTLMIGPAYLSNFISIERLY